jgi:phage terminase small subunit
MKLNARQKKFCDYYVECGNAGEAAKKAGYSEKYAAQNADKLLKNTNVQKYINLRTVEAASPLIASGNEILETLTQIMRNKRAKAADRIKAADMLGRRALIWTDKRKQDADLEKTLAETELTKEKTKLLKGAVKDTSLLEKLIQTVEENN